MVRNEYDLRTLLKLLSKQRLSPYLDLSKSASSAIILHQDALKLGMQLMVCIATLEISLRNAVFEKMSSHFKGQAFLVSSPPGFHWQTQEQNKLLAGIESAKRAAYAKAVHAPKKDGNGGQKGSAKPVQAPLSDSQLIPEMTFYFWKRLYSSDYEHFLWKPCLKKTFPDKRLSRAIVAAHLETIYQSRNRLAHHEPVLRRRFDKTVASIRFVAQHLEHPLAGTPSALMTLIDADLSLLIKQADNLHRQLRSFRKP